MAYEKDMGMFIKNFNMAQESEKKEETYAQSSIISDVDSFTSSQEEEQTKNSPEQQQKNKIR